MNSQYIIVVYLIINAFNPSMAEVCDDGNACPFGRCVLVAGKTQCKCDIDCTVFPQSFEHFGCSNRTNALGHICAELNEACPGPRNYRIRQLSLEEFASEHGYNCESVLALEEFPSEVEFCEQSYCNFNGVCLRQVRTGTEYCVCDLDHSGTRCDNNIVSITQQLVVSPVESSKMDVNYRTTTIIAFSLLGMFCMILVVTLICLRCKRDEKEVNLGNDEQNTSEEKAATTSSGDTIINVQNVERCGDPNAS